MKSCFILLVLLSVSLSSLVASAQSMSADQVVAKHLESIRAGEKGVKNVVATGLVDYTVLRKGGVGGTGKIVLASEGSKTLLGMTFSVPTYPAETFVFDGKNLKVAFAYNNVRSFLGDYVYRYNDIVKQGLMGGSLSTAWALADLDSRKAKVSFEGRKKVNDKDTFVLGYSPKGGSDLQIRLYFDASTFEHVRSEYRRVISSQVGSTLGGPVLGGGAAAADASARQREMRQIMIEDFSDYKKEAGGNFPHAYRIYVMLDGAEGTRELEWKAVFTEFFFDQPLDPASFNTDSK